MLCAHPIPTQTNARSHGRRTSIFSQNATSRRRCCEEAARNRKPDVLALSTCGPIILDSRPAAPESRPAGRERRFTGGIMQSTRRGWTIVRVPRYPPNAGAKWIKSARWRQAVNLAGKRFAVFRSEPTYNRAYCRPSLLPGLCFRSWIRCFHPAAISGLPQF